MKKVAKIISLVFHPLLIPTYGTALLFVSNPFPGAIPWFPEMIISLTVFLCTAVIPALFIFLFQKMGKISSFHLNRQKERTRPYAYSAGSYLLCAFYVQKFGMPLWFVTMLAGSAVAILILLVINIKWNISAHLAAMGALMGSILVVAYKYVINPYGVVIAVALVSAAVASARITLDAHTPAQTAAGFLDGFIVTVAAGLLFG